MYAECCGYILMSASALCIHVGMSACFARPFVRQSVSSARLSVRLMIVYHCACRYIFRPSICLIFRLSACLFTCTYVETNVLVCVLLSSKIDLSLHWTLISFVFFFVLFFSCRGSNDGIAGMCTFLCKNYVYDRQKSTLIFVSNNIVLFHKSFMTVTKGKSAGKSQTRYDFL